MEADSHDRWRSSFVPLILSLYTAACGGAIGSWWFWSAESLEPYFRNRPPEDPLGAAIVGVLHGFISGLILHCAVVCFRRPVMLRWIAVPVAILVGFAAGVFFGVVLYIGASC